MAGLDWKVNQVTLVWTEDLATLEPLASQVVQEQQGLLVTQVPLELLASLDQPVALAPLVVLDSQDRQVALVPQEPLVLTVTPDRRVKQVTPVWTEDLATLVAQAPLDSLDQWALQVSKQFSRPK